MMFELLTWIITALSIIGAILNARQRISGFYFWLGANASWVLIDTYKDLPAQAFLFIVYMGISIYGIYTWRRKNGE